jgi:hypothetical protein
MTTTGRGNDSDDTPPLPADQSHEPSLLEDGPGGEDGAAGASSGGDQPDAGLAPLSAAEIVSLEKIVRWVPAALVGYFFIALTLLLLALRRGRLFDAILVVTTLLLTIPPVLGYRAQARARLRSFFRQGDATVAGNGESEQSSPQGDSGRPT